MGSSELIYLVASFLSNNGNVPLVSTRAQTQAAARWVVRTLQSEQQSSYELAARVLQLTLVNLYYALQVRRTSQHLGHCRFELGTVPLAAPFAGICHRG